MLTKSFKLKNTILTIALFTAVFIISCENEEFYDGSEYYISMSADTVQFDTVFSTIGSVTKRFTISNPHNQKVKIDQIYLAGGDDSFFRINVDGNPGTSIRNVEIDKHDSLYIFVEVTVDPLNQNNPLEIKDSILFITGNYEQDVNLIAWGWDVTIIKNQIVGTETWTSEKPYLILNSMMVDTNEVLTIDAGTKLFFDKKSRLYVAGTIQVNGAHENKVVFTGARLDNDYQEIPGQWQGIWLMPGSSDNYINEAVIKNAIIGIQVDTFTTSLNPTLHLSNSIIKNMTSSALYAQGSRVYGYNNEFSNCGQYTTALTIGGTYEFYHCTFANYWNYSTRRTASVLLTNYYIDINDNYQVRPLEKAYFGNCIIYGNKESEILFDNNPAGDFNYYFDHSVLKIDQEALNASQIENCIINESPLFVAPYEYNYELDTLSVAKDAAKVEIANLFPLDLNHNSRFNDEGPDIGAYERIEDNN